MTGIYYDKNRMQADAMAGRILQQFCRAHAVLVAVAAFVSIAAFAMCYAPYAAIRGYELAVARIADVATARAALSTFIGGILFVASFTARVEPPDIVVRCTLIAVLSFTLTMTLLPAISQVHERVVRYRIPGFCSGGARDASARYTGLDHFVRVEISRRTCP